MSVPEYIKIFLLIAVLVLLLYHSFFQNSQPVINNSYSQEDSIIFIYNDSVIVYEKQKIKTLYEYKIDSILIAYLPDSALIPDIMSRVRRILGYPITATATATFSNSERFSGPETHRPSPFESGIFYERELSAEAAADSLRLHYQNSSEPPCTDSKRDNYRIQN